MLRYIFLGLLVLTPTLLYGPEWTCQDKGGCPIVNNTCPTCKEDSPTTHNYPEGKTRGGQRGERGFLVHHVPIIPLVFRLPIPK